MKIDFSKVLFEKYFSSSDRLIEVTLRNGRKITGVFVSFFHGDQSRNEPYVIKWYIVPEINKMTTGMDAVGFGLGELINQKDIRSVTFLDDYSQMQFE